MTKSLASLALTLTLGLGAGTASGQDSTGVEEGVLKLTIDDVRAVQQTLVGRGYAVEPVDGKVNESTRAALRRVEKGLGMKETGDLDIAALDALGFDAVVAISGDVKGADLARSEMTGVTERPAGMPRDASVVGKGGDRPIGIIILGPSQIERIQKRLKAEKLYLGETNGAFSHELMGALRTFQLANGIKATGLIDLPTLARFPEAKVRIEETGTLEPPPPPAATAPGGVIDRSTPGGGTGHDRHEKP